MRKSFIFMAIAVVLVILISMKVIHSCSKDGRQVVAAAVSAARAECYLIRDTIVEFPLRAVGFLRANEQVEIVSEISGRVLSIHFREGSFVRKGDLLFQLDDSEYKASLEKNEARLALAVRTEERSADMLETGGTSRHVYDESVSQRKVLEAEGDLLRVIIEKARIKAPFSGKVGLRNVSTGAYVTPGEVLTTLEDLSTLKIDFTVPQKYAGYVKVNDLLRFRTDGNPSEYHAVIEASDPSVNRKTGNLRVLARVINPDKGLVPGSAITVNMINKSDIPALYIPTHALLPTPSGYIVYAVVSGICTVKPVKTGLRSESLVEITEGVVKGDSILVTGFMKIRPGSKVIINKTW